jgi:hypothetical protein
MWVHYAIIALLVVILWLLVRRNQSLFRPAKKAQASRPIKWYKARVGAWKRAIQTLDQSTNRDDLVTKLKTARDKAPKKSLDRKIHNMAIIYAKKSDQLPLIRKKFESRMKMWAKKLGSVLSKFIKSSKTMALWYKQQIADVKKAGNIPDFITMYQKKVQDMMAKKSTFAGEENIPDSMRIQMYQQSISNAQKAGSVDAFVKSLQTKANKVKKAISKKMGRKKMGKAKKAKQVGGGNYYFYFNSVPK